MLDPLPLVAKVFNLVVQEEKQRTIGPEAIVHSSDSMAFNSISSTSPSSLAAVNSMFKPKNENRPVCSHCGITGHTVARCYKLHGYPPG